MIDQPPPRTVYSYGAWQDKFRDIQENHDVEFIPGLAEVLDKDFFDAAVPTLLVIDDLAQNVADDTGYSKLFTQGIHHKNVCILLPMRNLYKQGKSMRDVHLNAQYLILYKNVRDVNQIKVVERQTGLSHLSEAYAAVTKKLHTPLVVDMEPDTPDYLRVRSHIQLSSV
ncbi:hypothetical protein RvY_02006 [Ramazzottius varieornatus]|uniref:Uncharacterized protein n=1 Tax=Ramazzottius varieornatus TaxID=947166 RepID=A0A1D1UQB1_RAMVA|nr:hypothetical protein RvY_02006 [Ramazzottius varieornatus]